MARAVGGPGDVVRHPGEQMVPDDEKEMRRLCELLAAVEATLPPTSPLREGLEKGALAIQACFVRGHGSWVDGMYACLHGPNTELTADQRAHLARLGIEPDA